MSSASITRSALGYLIARQRWWKTYLAVGFLVAVGYSIVPALHTGIVFNALGLSPVVAILVSVRAHRPADRRPWFLFALGQSLFLAGDVLTYNYSALFGGDLPFPSIGDPLYLLVYPCLAAGILLIIRDRNPGDDRASLIDSLVVAIGIGSVSWVLLLSPIAAATDSTLDQKIVGMAYPVGDLFLLAVVVKLALSGGHKAMSFNLMIGAAAALLATDSIYSYIVVQGIVYTPSGGLEIGWGAFYLLWGAAALHPSMTSLGRGVPEGETRLSRPRLVLLAGAAVLAEATHLLVDSSDGILEEPVLSAASAALFLLVVARMAGLVRREEHAASRERALREAAVSLVAAADRDGVYRAALAAVGGLVGTAPIRILTAANPATSFGVAASAGGGVGWRTAGIRLMDLSPETRGRLLERQSTGEPFGQDERAELDLPTDIEYSVVLPLFVRSDLKGLLAIALAKPPTRAVIDGLNSLSAQIALALESVDLAENLASRRSQQRFTSLVQNSSDVIIVVEPDTTVRFVSPAAHRVLGRASAELEGQRLADLVPPAEATRVIAFLDGVARCDESSGCSVELQIRHADGHWLRLEALASNLMADPNVAGIVLNTRDVSERKAFEDQLARQAFYDSLTNLANRALFNDRIEHALERGRRDGLPVSILFMDLDDFKTVNDSLGHTAGDQVLTEVGERLRRCMRGSDTAARFGGDEFAVLLDGDATEAEHLAGRVLGALETPIVAEGLEVHARATIGIATSHPGRRGAESAAELLRDADVAMYSGKERGKARFVTFEPEMHQAVRRRLELKAALDRAVERGEFVLHYQPIVDLATGDVEGMEALIRWIHPELGVIPPADFIPLAEETGLIVPIGRWVLEQAFRTAVRLDDLGRPARALHIAVNLSARQLQRPEIVSEVLEVLNRTGLRPESLVLEITESLMMQETELAVERLRALKTIGVQLAIDDFGTGYSSLGYLGRLPVDILKVDRSFIQNVAEAAEQRAVVATIIELARIHRLRVVAEGIERPDQVSELRALGCQLAQGYYFARPTDEAGLFEYLAGHLRPAPLGSTRRGRGDAAGAAA